MAKYGFKYFRQRFMDVPRWAGVHSLSRIYRYIKSMSMAVLNPPKKPESSQTFEQVIETLSLTDSDIRKLQQQKGRMATVYAVLFWLGFAYWLYLFYQQLWMAVLMMSSFQFLMFAFYFRESFWCVQLKKRKLGLSFKDWMREVIK